MAVALFFVGDIAILKLSFQRLKWHEATHEICLMFHVDVKGLVNSTSSKFWCHISFWVASSTFEKLNH